MALIGIREPNGWTPLFAAQLKPNGEYFAPFSRLPTGYLPSNRAYVASFNSHDKWPITWCDLSFLLAFTGNFTLLQTLLGMSIFLLLSTQQGSYTMGIGKKITPQTYGYCLGDKFKEQNYWVGAFSGYANVLGTGILNYTFALDVAQKHDLRRIYAHHGVVQNFEVIDEFDPNDPESVIKNFVLTFDIETDVLKNLTEDEISNLPTPAVRITRRSNGEQVTVRVQRFYSNKFQFLIDDPEILIESGDFFEFNGVYCLEDPFLLAGDWLGLENDTENGSLVNELGVSPFNVHMSSQCKFFLETEISGVYVPKDGDENVINAAPNANFDDVDGVIKWNFVYLDKRNYIYGDDDRRWGFSREIFPREETSLGEEYPDNIEGFEIIERDKGSAGDITAFTEAGANFFRIELAIGSQSALSNFHAPILKREWVIQGGKWFQVLGQPEGSVIDVSYLDVTGQSEFDTSGEIKIFNQYAWMILEHYGSNLLRGIFGGQGQIQGDTIIVENKGQTGGTYEDADRIRNRITPDYLTGDSDTEPVNSFYNRYRLDTCPDGGTVKLWKKFQNWRLSSDRIEGPLIKEISFSDYPPQGNSAHYFDEYDIDFKFEDSVDLESVFEGSLNSLYVAFGAKYPRFRGSNRGVLWSQDFNLIPGTGWTNPTGDSVCDRIDTIGSYLTVVEAFLDIDTVIGICDGQHMGLQNSLFGVISRNYVPFTISFPNASLGVSTIYNPITQEGTIAYVDSSTQTVVLRNGSLGFKEYPEKIELLIGPSHRIEEFSSFPIDLSESDEQERVKMLYVQVPNTQDDLAYIIFTFNNKSDVWGFPNSGLGSVDLQAIRREADGNGNVPTYLYENDGRSVSPVYIYTKNRVSPTEFKRVSLSASKVQRIDSIEIFEGIDQANHPVNGKIEYATNIQALSAFHVKNFDIHRGIDGECIFVYSRNLFGKLKDEEGGNFYNDPGSEPEEDSSAWLNSECVFAIGSSDEGIEWGAPVAKDWLPSWANIESVDNSKWQHPLMILTGAQYLTSIYDKRSNVLCIFSRHNDDSGLPYLGCLRISYNTILYSENLVLQEYLGNEEYVPIEGAYDPRILWRHPVLDMDEDKNKWTYDNAIFGDPEGVDDIFGEDSPKIKDSFVRIEGVEGTDATLITEDANWQFPSASIGTGGYYRFLYSDAFGLRMIFSTGGNYKWKKSAVILSREASSGIYFEEDSVLISLTPSGIEVKFVGYDDLQYCYLAVEGGEDEDILEDTQSKFDDADTVFASSAEIDPQKITGYKDSLGVYYVFFYTKDNVISGVKSSNLYNWNIIENF